MAETLLAGRFIDSNFAGAPDEDDYASWRPGAPYDKESYECLEGLEAVDENDGIEGEAAGQLFAPATFGASPNFVWAGSTLIQTFRPFDFDPKRLEGLKMDLLFEGDENVVLYDFVSNLTQNGEKQTLKRFINKIASEGLSWDFANPGLIHDDSAQAAIEFVDLLEQTAQLPKVGPDGEGGVLMVWKFNGQTTSVSVNGRILTLVTGVASPNARYYEELAFDGSEIPSVIRAALKH